MPSLREYNEETARGVIEAYLRGDKGWNWTIGMLSLLPVHTIHRVVSLYESEWHVSDEYNPVRVQIIRREFA